MANNKIQLADGTVLLDISSDTIVADKLASGYVAHDKSGVRITGTVVERSFSDVTVNGQTITVPAGMYGSQVQKSVPTETGSFSANGNYTPSSGKLYSSVIVAIPEYDGSVG